ncbi:MAG: 50S ribosomal protein L21e [Candidatus Altiarchaeales archaeon]|nr:50S ribosomal protein L21e [Candidatus Altiarchaeales archaeon]
MKGSQGIRRRTRNLRKNKRDKGKIKIRQYLQDFAENETVSISIDTGYQSIPHPRFQGKTGKVVGRQGRSYLVMVKDGGKQKKLVIPPQHLKKSG